MVESTENDGIEGLVSCDNDPINRGRQPADIVGDSRHGDLSSQLLDKCICPCTHGVLDGFLLWGENNVGSGQMNTLGNGISSKVATNAAHCVYYSAQVSLFAVQTLAQNGHKQFRSGTQMSETVAFPSSKSHAGNTGWFDW